MSKHWTRSLFFFGVAGITGMTGLAGCAGGGESPELTREADAADARALTQAMAHFNAHARVYGLSNPSEELRMLRSRAGERGMRHMRYGQYFRGVKVFEGEAIAHVDTAGQVTVSDTLRRDLRVEVQPTISSDQAIGEAMAAHGAQGEVRDPQAQLEILPRGRVSEDHLVWHVRVLTEDDTAGAKQADYFVDAHTGKIVWSFDSLETTASTGTGRTMHSGSQAIGTDFVSNTYYLRDPTRGGGNYTCDLNNRTNTCADITRTNNIFGDGVLSATITDRATAAADAHFGMQTTWDYFRNTFGRNGINNAGRRAYSRVHYSRNYVNAFWSDSCFCMTYGDGSSSYYPLVSLDIAGHEMAHGVMASEANLTYSGESGGLNESSSDIFGTLVEFYANNAVDTPDWLIGERIYVSNFTNGVLTGSRALRYMARPNQDGASPNCWTSTLGSLDVHYSSGPNNHMFYLLANGGASACNGQSVAGIGRDAAARIWYNAISNYMTSSTNYAGARAASLNSAAELYGVGSAQYNAVAAAYSAINVN